MPSFLFLFGSIFLQYLFIPTSTYYTSPSSVNLIKMSLLLQRNELPKKSTRYKRQASATTNNRVYIQYGLHGIELHPIYGRAATVGDDDFLIKYTANLVPYQPNTILIVFDINSLFSDLQVCKPINQILLIWKYILRIDF